jgi:Raf kinase inhibitor-like YbhB/YbcL family protein
VLHGLAATAASTLALRLNIVTTAGQVVTEDSGEPCSQDSDCIPAEPNPCTGAVCDAGSCSYTSVHCIRGYICCGNGECCPEGEAAASPVVTSGDASGADESEDQGASGVTDTETPVSPQALNTTCDPYARLAPVPAFTVTSTNVADGEPFPTPQMSGIFGAGGEDLSPQLTWSGFPEETRSFVVTMFDPDAPIPSGFWHWAVADIPASVSELPTGAGTPDGSGLPAGAFQLPNDARLAQYVGPAPPPGDSPHRYSIAVTAVDVDSLGVDQDATPALLYGALIGHTLGRAMIVPVAASAG